MTIALASLAIVGPTNTAPAEATPFGPEIHHICPSGYTVKLVFVISGGGFLRVGHGYTQHDTNYNAWQMDSGKTYTKVTGYNTYWTQKWADPGSAYISSWGKYCVNYS